ncbi:gliding motility-associated C-terminal domain-containing protein [Capnocytophaga sp.]|uniref:Ig-like domain-containing protein n=1 Tax=Capnocytophaga sp. TaxID=44737 RepID=UPI0026DB1923|nr:gliding motility-associated C-terminal domain-containing protein [Capnocytophaga sp.]MDO5104427.1 gliding motility-associated C-terminal domain-containing protein [Capnocytophaga sp.]
MNTHFSHSVLTWFLLLVAGVSFSQNGGKVESVNFLNNTNYICARDGHNNFAISFKWTPPLPNANNQYVIELSDANGNFSNPTLLKTITGQNTSFEINTTISFPNSIRGDGYKVRVSSSNPSSSAESRPFQAYFIKSTTSLKLNNGVSTLALCPGHSQEISVDRTDEAGYKWYKDNQLIAGATGPSLRVSEPGAYYATPDYGQFCSQSASDYLRSNIVNVTVGGNTGLAISSSSTDNTICKGQTVTFTANQKNASYTYKWYRNDVVVREGVGLDTYTTPADDTAAGKYYLGISATGQDCEERTNVIEIKFKEEFNASVTLTGSDFMLPGASRQLTAQTTAENPTYQWLLNGNPISGATSAQYTATQPGEYQVKVTQQGTCSGSVTSEKVVLKSPTNFKVEIKYKSATYQACLYDKTSLAIEKILAVTTTEEVEMDASTYNMFNFQWYKGTEAVSGATTTELFLQNISQNGTYSLQVSASGYTIPRSNELPIQLVDANAIKLNQGRRSIEFCTGTVTLTAEPADASATYTWYKDGVQVLQELGKHEYQVSQTGTYHVSITKQNDVGCPATSNSIVAIKDDVTAGWSRELRQREVYIEGKTYELTISHTMTNPSIKWFRNGTEISGQTGLSLTITQSGSYYAELINGGTTCANEKRVTPTQYFIEVKSLKPTVGFKSQNQSDNCNGTATEITLELQKLEGVLVGEDPIPLSANDFGSFTYQWLKDGTPISGQTNPGSLVVQNDGTVGDYSLQAFYKSSITESNKLRVSFASVPDVTILSGSANNTPHICPGGTATLTSSVSSAAYSYQWYKEGGKIDGAVEAVYEASEPGSYYIEVSNGACTKKSPVVSVNYFTADNVKIIRLDNNAQIANGASFSASKGLEVGVLDGSSDYEYYWSTPTQQTSGERVTVTEAGTYTLTATIGSTCAPVTIVFTISELYEINEIPNVVTPNGDGFNDFWEIPNEYSNKANVRVRIYSQEGKVVFDGINYDNRWPNANTTKDLGQRALLYIYTIEVDGKVEKQGVITIIK